MKTFQSTAQLFIQNGKEMIGIWTDGVMVSAPVDSHFTENSTYDVSIESISDITSVVKSIDGDSVTFEGTAQKIINDSIDETGFTIDGVSLFSDSEQPCFYHLSENSSHRVTVKLA